MNLKPTKSKLAIATLFTLTAGAVVLYPAYQSIGANRTTNNDSIIDPIVDVRTVNPITNERPKIEVVFVLDTTGSMTELIQAAKEKIWSIASTMASAQNAPEIRMGLVAYRDRGDQYITHRIDLSSDLDTMYANLMNFKADGGGDRPESVNQALYEAVNKMSWSEDNDTYKVVFLVGDAPAHMDYQNDVKYPVTIANALQKGIVVNTIQCGQDTMAMQNWQHVAQLANGEYFQVDQAGSAVAITTPFDQKLAELSTKLDDTRMVFGDEEVKQKNAAKEQAVATLEEQASVASRARRAAFNVSASGEKNLLGEGELVDAVTSGRVDLSSIEEDQLPAALAPMEPAEREKLITETAQIRDDLRKQIKEASEQRSAYLKKEVEKVGGAKDSLDNKIYRAVQSQAADVGLLYESDAPEY